MPLLLRRICVIHTLRNLPRRFDDHFPSVRRRGRGAILARIILDELSDVGEGDGVVACGRGFDDFLGRSRAGAGALDVAVCAGEDAAVGDFVEAFVVLEEGFGWYGCVSGLGGLRLD